MIADDGNVNMSLLSHMIAVHSSKRSENPTYRPLVPLVLDCLHTFGYAKAMLIAFTGAGAVVVPL
jgi:hypothetical protein